MTPAFEARGLTFSYEHAATTAVCDVGLAIPHGSLCAVIGPNGSGKSTLVRLLLGAEKPSRGSATYSGRNAAEWDRAELARTVGVVTQMEEIVFPLSVRELVAMGRYPHLGAYRSESDVDRTAVSDALRYCDLDGLADRAMNTLSGGERQRARIARALAQQPRVLVLDEPTAALDIAHEMAIFELLATFVARDGATVVVVTHNVNLAARYATQLVLMESGHIAAQGVVADVMTRMQIETTYQWPVTVHPHAGPGQDTGAPQIAPLRKEDE